MAVRIGSICEAGYHESEGLKYYHITVDGTDLDKLGAPINTPYPVVLNRARLVFEKHGYRPDSGGPVWWAVGEYMVTRLLSH